MASVLMFQTATVTAVDAVNNLVQIQYTKSGTISKTMVPAIFGSAVTGIQYTPTIGDLVFIDDTDGFHVYIIGTLVAANQLHNDTFGYGLKSGELIIFNNAGASIKLNFDGSISLTPAPNKAILVGDATITSMQPVARNGDTVTGTDSNGDTFTGVIHSSTSTLLST